MVKKGVVGALVAAAAGVLATTAFGINVICVAGSESCDGTNSADQITGSTDDDHIFAKGGNDEIAPNAGADVTIAGPGRDIVYDDAGVDRVVGGPGRDFLNEFEDLSTANKINGGPGGDCIGGGPAGDTIRGSGGSEHGEFFKCGEFGIYGFEGADRLIGGAGGDRIIGGPGGDLFSGGKGNDYLDARGGDAGGNDTLKCGRGFDRYSASPSDSVAGDCERRIPPPEARQARRW